ncbi:MAG: hypothetical protein Q4E67_01770 [Planctomycetia bacterium]|nr:hypothetical protein [Planctomycetia bacterium]
MNDFSVAVDSSVETLFQMSASSISYKTRGQTRCLKAVRAGTSWHDIESVKSTRLLSSNRDYICRASDFADEKPIPKDVITDSDGEWVVYNLAQEECWRPLGISTSFIRIHCRK